MNSKYMYTRYTYLRDNNGTPHTCIAIRVDSERNQINFALSTCNIYAREILRNRIRMIKALGGIVPVELANQLRRTRSHFAKSEHRFIACKRLENFWHSISVTDANKLSGHDITRLVMEYIVNNRPRLTNKDVFGQNVLVKVPGMPLLAVHSARNWLLRNVEGRETLPALRLNDSLLDSIPPSSESIDDSIVESVG